MKRLGFLFGIMAISLLTSRSMGAGWVVTDLQPGTYYASAALAVSPGLQEAGDVAGPATGSNYHAAMWTGTSSSLTDLNPSGATYSCLLGANGKQYGVFSGTSTSNNDHACLWNGTSASCVDLNPSGATYSCCQAGSGITQVGYAYGTVTGSNEHACLWIGTTSSFRDLNPSGCAVSHAWATSGTQEVGDAYGTVTGGYYHASLWTGTSSSWVDLSPAGSADSYAYGMTSSQQVGSANINGYWQAGLWSGTSASWVNLNPASATESEAYAVSGSVQAGYAIINGYNHACVWNGSSAGFTDLHTLLPSNYTDSFASGVCVSVSDIYVGGYAYNGSTGYPSAFLWHYVRGSVTGTVTLQSYQANITLVPVTIEIQAANGSLLEAHTVNLSSSGGYSLISQQPAGSYVAAAKASHWLARDSALTLDTNGIGTASFLLLNGDVNGDNFVEDQDYSLLGAAWYSGVGDSNYNVNADLNGDGYVEDQDYSIMGSNWYSSGDHWD